MSCEDLKRHHQDNDVIDRRCTGQSRWGKLRKKNVGRTEWERPRGEMWKPVRFYLEWCLPIRTNVTFSKVLKTWQSKRKVMNSELVIILTMGSGTSKRSTCGDRGLRNSSVTLESAATHPRSSSWSRLAPWSLINQIKGFQQWQIALQSQW